MYWYHYTDSIYYGNSGGVSLYAYTAVVGPIEYNGKLYGTKDNPVYQIYYRNGLLTQEWNILPLEGVEIHDYYGRIFGHIEHVSYGTSSKVQEIPGAKISGKYRFYKNISGTIPCGFSIPCNFMICYEDGTIFSGNSIRAITHNESGAKNKYCGVIWKDVLSDSIVSWGDDDTTSQELPTKSQNCVIDFGVVEQEVPAFILEWVELNADKVEQDTRSLTIDITTPNGIRLETENTFCDRNIVVLPKLQEKTATTSGEVVAEEGYAGLSKVVVDVPDNFEEGYASGKTDGIAEGIQTEKKRFWDDYLPTNGFGDLLFAGPAWSESTLTPDRDIVLNGTAETFYYNRMKVDLVEHFAKLGVTLTLSDEASNVHSTFAYSAFTRVGNVGSRGASSLNSYFRGNTNLVTIDLLRVCDSTSATYTSTFSGCTSLENITIEGEIKNDIDMSSSPLTATSLDSVISHLSDSATGRTASFALNAVNAAFGSIEGATDGAESQEWLDLVATKPNWTISLV